MSKKFVQEIVYVPNIVPSNYKDEIFTLVDGGNYGLLKDKLETLNIRLSHDKNLYLHRIINSDMTEIQKKNIIELLIKKGAYINALDERNLSAIYYSIKNQLFEITKLLIDSGANLNIKLPIGFDLITTVLIPSTNKCNLNDINISNKYVYTYLKIPDIQKDFKEKIYDLKSTEKVIENLIKYFNNIENESIEYYDMNDYQVKKTFFVSKDNVNTILPPFENSYKKFTQNMISELYKSLKSDNNDLIFKFTDIQKRLKDNIKNYINYKTDIPKIKQIDNTLLIKDDYKTIKKDNITFGQYTSNIKQKLIDKYKKESEEVFNYIQDDYNEINNCIKNINKIWMNINQLLPDLRDDDYPFYRINFPSIDNILKLKDDNILENYKNILSYYNEYIKKLETISDSIYTNEKSDKIENIKNRLPPRDVKLIDNFNQEINKLKRIFDKNIEEVYPKNIKKYNMFIIDINNTSNMCMLYNSFIKKKEEYLLNDNILLVENTDNINEFYSNKKLKVCSPNQIVNYYNINTNTRENIEDDQNACKKDNYQILPSGELNYNYIQFMSMIFYNSVYDEMTTTNEYNKIRDKYKNKNLKINVNDELTFRTFHDIINTCYKEIIEIIVNKTSERIINKELQKVIYNTTDKELENIIIDALKQFNTNEVENVPKIPLQKYYLDENYIDYTPIDVELFTCLKNNIELIKLIRKNKYIKAKEYQEILFRLGDKEILKYLNDKTSDFDKIKPIDLTYYLRKHEEKFKNNLKFLIDKYNQDIISNELGMFKIKDNKILEIDNIDIPIPIVFKNSSKYRIINDIAVTRNITTKYITDNIKSKLKDVFKEIIIPTLKNFFNLYAGTMMDDIMDYTQLEYIIVILIDNIINKILQVDIRQIDEEKISMNDVVTNLSNVFMNRLKNYSANYTSKQFLDVYDEMFKVKLIAYLDKISNYYNNLYQNHIKFIFNHTRYSLLKI